MTTTTPTTPTTASSPATGDVSAATAIGCVLLALGSLGYLTAGILTGAEPGREGFLHPINAPASALAALGATILALTLAAWRPDGLPRWATQVAAAGMVFVAAGAWLSATVLVSLAQTSPDDETFLAAGASAWALAFFAPKAIQLVAFLAMAVTGWRTRAIPRAACVVLVPAALLSLWPPFPPGGILAALAFFVISRRPMPA
jgi:hypothetical protein